MSESLLGMWRRLRTLCDTLALWYGLALLGAICLSWCALAAILHPLLPRRWGRPIGRFAIMAGFRIYLRALRLTGQLRCDLSALDALKGERSLVIACNHPCLLDAVLLVSRLPNAVCIMKADLVDNIFLGAGARLAGYMRNDSAHGMVRLAVAELREGAQLLVFPEGTRTARAPVNPFKPGFALMARKAGVPIQSVFIETDSPYLSKGWPLFKRPAMPIAYRVRLGRRFDPPQDITAFMAEFERYYAQQLLGAKFGELEQVPVGADPRSA